MIDDALHCYSAAQYEYFTTDDDRSKYKAEKTFDRLKISSVVLNATDFAETILVE